MNYNKSFGNLRSEMEKPAFKDSKPINVEKLQKIIWHACEISLNFDEMFEESTAPYILNKINKEETLRIIFYFLKEFAKEVEDWYPRFIRESITDYLKDHNIKKVQEFINNNNEWLYHHFENEKSELFELFELEFPTSFGDPYFLENLITEEFIEDLLENASEEVLVGDILNDEDLEIDLYYDNMNPFDKYSLKIYEHIIENIEEL